MFDRDPDRAPETDAGLVARPPDGPRNVGFAQALAGRGAARRRLLAGAGAGAALASLAGCGSAGFLSLSTGFLRTVTLSVDTGPLNFFLDGRYFAGPVPFLGSSPFLEVFDRSRTVSVAGAFGGGVLRDAPIFVNETRLYTFAVTSLASGLQPVLVEQFNVLAPPGTTRMSIAHCAGGVPVGSIGPIDVVFAPVGVDPSSVAPLAANLPFLGQAFVAPAAGTWTVQLRRAATATVLSQFDAVTFATGEFVLLIADDDVPPQRPQVLVLPRATTGAVVLQDPRP